MEKVLIGDTEYNYQINENGEEILTTTVELDNKEMQLVIKGDSSRKLKRN